MGALGPLSVLSYLQLLSRRGILVKDGRVFELLRGVDTVVFDKTGTLTLEQPTVGRIHAFGEHDEDGVLRAAATAEYRQPHPIARAILAAAAARGVALQDLEGGQLQRRLRHRGAGGGPRHPRRQRALSGARRDCAAARLGADPRPGRSRQPFAGPCCHRRAARRRHRAAADYSPGGRRRHRRIETARPGPLHQLRRPRGPHPAHGRAARHRALFRRNPARAQGRPGQGTAGGRSLGVLDGNLPL